MRLNSVIAGLLMLPLGACSGIEVMVDYDAKADFSTLHTWSWLTEQSTPQSRESQAPRFDPLTLQRVKTAVEAELTLEGFPKTVDEKADFLVSVNASHVRRIETDADWGWGDGWGCGYGWGPYWGGTWGPPAVYVSKETYVAIDIFERRPNLRAIWRGVVNILDYDSLSPEERENRIRQAVGEALENFPPGRTHHKVSA
ncbi:MAG TPA: DUF4136 domain-containing protein [Planctomycetota bacterium]|nr:DUF4136 domain-containing protein [Planctomycetota bacterium]